MLGTLTSERGLAGLGNGHAADYSPAEEGQGCALHTQSPKAAIHRPAFDPSLLVRSSQTGSLPVTLHILGAWDKHGSLDQV